MNKLAKNSFIYTIGGGLQPLLNFLLLPVYTSYLLPAEYGIITAIYALIALFRVFYTLCLEKSMIRLYWDCKTETAQNIFLSTIIIGVLSVSLLMTGVSLFFINPIKTIFPDIPPHPYYIIALVLMFDQILLNLVQNYFRIKEKAKAFIFMSLGHFLLKIAIVVPLLVVFEKGLLGYFLGGLATSLVFFLIYALILKSFFVFSFSYKYFKSAFGFATPYLPGITGSWVIGNSDKVIIAGLLSVSDLGVYAISAKISSVIGIIAQSFKNAYFPHFFKTASLHTKDKAIYELKKTNDIFIQVILFIGFALVFFSKDIVIHLLDTKYHDAYKYIPLLILAVLLSTISSVIFGATLQQNRQTIADSTLALLTAGVALVLNILLIKQFALWGAVFAKLFSMAFHFVASYFYSKKSSFTIPFDWAKFLLTIVFYFAVHFAFMLSFNVFEAPLILRMLAKFSTVSVIALFLFQKHFKHFY